MHIYEAYLIEKIKKKRSYLISLRNPLAKYLISLSLFFLSHFSNISRSHLAYKTRKNWKRKNLHPPNLLLHQIYQLNPRNTILFRSQRSNYFESIAKNNSIKIRKKKMKSNQNSNPSGILKPKNTVRITWIFGHQWS